jgi:hypothetical protein
VSVDLHGFRLGIYSDRHGQHVRWLRRDGTLVTIRDVVGALEAYEPARTITREALTRPSTEAGLSVLRAELRRLVESPIVLNRLLREAVLADRRSLSEIAMACGAWKEGLRLSGDTQWLQRKIGVLPGKRGRQPTPWVTTGVLARIAQGLGIEPRLVEVDVEEDVDFEEHWCSRCRETVTTALDGVCPWCETNTLLAVAA